MLYNMIIEYPVLLMKSIGNYGYEALGRIAKKSGDTISRLLRPASEHYQVTQMLAQELFRDDTQLYLAIDDTLLRKVYSRLIEGAGRFYDTRIGRKVMGLKLLVAAVTNGRHTIPLSSSFLFAKELLQNTIQSKDTIVQEMIELTLKLFPNKVLTVVVDGAFATIVLLKWCIERKVRFLARIHCNRKVLHKGSLICIRDIADLRLKGRWMSRTIAVTWHELSVYITAHRRIDKNGKETIIYLVATYQARPAQYAQHYAKRWSIEMLFRTTKQHLGLQDCSARKLESQEAHISAVMLAYSLLQIDTARRRIPTPESALRAAKHKNATFLKHKFCRILEALPQFHA